MALLNLLAGTQSGRAGFVGGLALSVLLLAAGPGAPAQAQPSSEYQIKAIFLFNFAQYVDWAPEAFGEAASPLIVGVLGDDPFGAILDEAVRGEKVNNRPLVVQRFRRVEDVQVCHILFVSRSETEGLDRILGSLKGRSTLTVGDADKFAERGGVIQFVTQKNNVRVRINLESAKAAHVTISSKLLRTAEIVSPRKK
jgi:hypothetical protein